MMQNNRPFAVALLLLVTTLLAISHRATSEDALPADDYTPRHAEQPTQTCADPTEGECCDTLDSTEEKDRYPNIDTPCNNPPSLMHHEGKEPSNSRPHDKQSTTDQDSSLRHATTSTSTERTMTGTADDNDDDEQHMESQDSASKVKNKSKKDKRRKTSKRRQRRQGVADFLSNTPLVLTMAVGMVILASCKARRRADLRLMERQERQQRLADAAQRAQRQQVGTLEERVLETQRRIQHLAETMQSIEQTARQRGTAKGSTFGPSRFGGKRVYDQDVWQQRTTSFSATSAKPRMESSFGAGVMKRTAAGTDDSGTEPHTASD